jgi:hypothetical protein
MSSTFSNLKFELIGNGEQSGVWGTTTNANIGTAIEQAIVGMATLDSGDFTANVCTLTLSNTNAAQDARALCLNIAAGAVSAAGTVNVPAIQKPYLIINGSSYTVTVKVSGQTGVAVPAGTRTVVYNNGTDVGTQLNWLSSLTLGTALPIASGGTGSTSTTFVNLATNVTGTLPVANGGTGATTAANARTALSAQETLVSGTNIKTVNGTSLLGSGNIAVVTAPAGSSTQVQFNNAGSFGASSNLTFDGATLSVSGLSVGPGAGSGFQNTALGISVLANATSASVYNTGVGYQALSAVSSGDANTAVGWNALLQTNTGLYNTAVGASALQNQQTANFNTAVGYQALRTNTGGQNAALGSYAGDGTTSGSSNVFVGDSAGYSNSPTTPEQCTFVGSAAGYNAGNGTNGTNNTCLGYNANPSTSSVSNTITLGNTSIATLRCQVTTITSLSDRRDKTDLGSLGDALNLIRNIVPVRFVWNMRDGGKVGEADTGFIAQQLLEAQQVSDMHIPGLVDETNPDKLEAGYGKLIPVLVKALQQLDAEFQAYKLAHP